MKRETKEKTKISLICATCGKPIADKPKTNVTRFLFKESRCTCSTGSSDTSFALAPKEQTVTDPSISENLGDRYEVLSLLGQGGMGAVYKVKDKALDKIFAVKVLNSGLVEDQTSIMRFESEAEAAKSLNHPNLVAVYDFGRGAKGAPYIVMDYLEGANLGDLLAANGHLDALRATDIFIQVAAAAEHAHTLCVIHRDIKPSNIILLKNDGGPDFVKLVDFGIAKVLPSQTTATKNLTQTGDIFGSPLYMSPEQCLGNDVDSRSDIYALGCVMYETLTGASPFAAGNPVKIILNHINNAPPAMAGNEVPTKLEQIILRCLEKDPADRYQSMEALLKDLEAFREGRPLSSKPIKKKKANTKLTPLRTAALAIATLAIIMSIASQYSSIPHGALPTITTSDAYKDALEFDSKSLYYFNKGNYKQALPLLVFDIETFKDKLKHSTKQDLQTEGYLADSLQHAGKCCLALKDYSKAEEYYKEALQMYMGFGNYQGGLMNEALIDYGTVLNAMGRTQDAGVLKDIEREWESFYRSHPSTTADKAYWAKTAALNTKYGQFFKATTSNNSK